MRSFAGQLRDFAGGPHATTESHMQQRRAAAAITYLHATAKSLMQQQGSNVATAWFPSDELAAGKWYAWFWGGTSRLCTRAAECGQRNAYSDF